MNDGFQPPPTWTEDRVLKQFWFPFNTRSARADVVVHDPAACYRFGVRFDTG